MERYENLFKKIKIKNTEIKNRLIMAPMATRFASFYGEVTERLIRYYEERAKGGVGLITVEATAISPEGIGWRNNLSIYDDHFIPGLQRLTETLHRHGAKVSLEIFHTGRKAPDAIIGQKSVAPSAVSLIGGVTPRELEIREIRELVKKFGNAAKRAKNAGFDVVNLHMAHGYLINQFLSPLTNKRTDQYGGNTEKRCQFAIEVIREVRRQVGKDFPVFCRLTAEEGMGSIGIDVNESVKIAPLLEDAGADAIDISGGASDKPYLTEGTYSLESGFLVYLAKAIKKSVKIPVTIVGKIKNPEFAESILKDGFSDFIVLGRSMIADPHWPKKVLENRENEIVPCISCVQGCTGRLGKDLDISCTVNPIVGREGMFDGLERKKSKRILIAGSGVAGMFAANALAKQGHQIMLLEKSDSLGGQLNLAAVPGHKTADLKPLLEYLKNQLEINQVDINLNEEAKRESIKKYAPDILIQATGAKPRTFPIEGTEKIQIMTAWDVLRSKSCPGEHIAVIGGGEVGLETAEFITSKLGKKVYVFEILTQYGKDMNRHEKNFLLQRIENSGIEIFTQARVMCVKGNQLHFERGDLEEEVGPIDTIVFSAGSQPHRQECFNDLYIPVHSIGDCTVPRRMYEAIHAAYRLTGKI